MNKLILSTHVPKTGGHSFLLILRDLFGRSIFIDHPNHPRPYPACCVDEIRNREIRVIHGHGARIDKWENYLPPFEAVAWVRNPYTRVISHYEYALYRFRFGKHNPTLTEVLKAKDFEEYCKVMPSHQCAFLPLERLNDYSFVGIVEDYQRCLDAFGDRFLGVRDLYMPVDNVNNTRGPNAKYELTHEQKASIEKYNEKDFELYARAKERWV